MASKAAQTLEPQGKESAEQMLPPGLSWASAWAGGPQLLRQPLGGTHHGATSTGRHGLRSTLPVLGCVVLLLGQKGMLERWVVLALPSASLLVLLPALGLPFWTAPHGHGLSCPCLHLT